jgi:hypothetical protein
MPEKYNFNKYEVLEGSFKTNPPIPQVEGMKDSGWAIRYNAKPPAPEPAPTTTEQPSASAQE